MDITIERPNKNPGAALTVTRIEASNSNLNNSKTPKKWQRVLAAFYLGENFNRFEAERKLSDHCLHTTVSTLQDMGLVVARRFETVPGYKNIPTRVCRYWLDPNSKELAKKLLPKRLIEGEDYECAA